MAQNTTDNTLFSGTSDADTLQNWGVNVTINAGDGDDNIYNDSQAFGAFINADGGNDSVNNNADNVTIDGGEGNDRIRVFASYASINGGAGDDSIYVDDDALKTTVATGSGNDTLTLWATDTTRIEAGAGSNLIRLSATNDGVDLIIRAEGDSSDAANISFEYYNGASVDNMTLIGGGNAVFNGTESSEVFVQENGDNTIVGYGGEDVISLTGALTQSTIEGNDVILTTNDGNLTVKNAKGHYLKVVDSTEPNRAAAIYGGSDAKTPQDVIKRFMNSMANSTSTVASDILNNAINAVTGGQYSNSDTLIAKIISDAADPDFLAKYCGIVLDNSDTGAITGSDAGGETTKTAEKIVPESSSVIYPTSNTFSIRGLNVKVPELSTLTDSQNFDAY